MRAMLMMKLMLLRSPKGYRTIKESVYELCVLIEIVYEPSSFVTDIMLHRLLDVVDARPHVWGHGLKDELNGKITKVRKK